jgi:hypothetical protein
MMRQPTCTLPRPPTSPNQAPPEDPGLIALTVAEIKRLLNLITQKLHTEQFLLWWSFWRRHHQARARWFHQRVRLQQVDETT